MQIKFHSKATANAVMDAAIDNRTMDFFGTKLEIVACQIKRQGDVWLMDVALVEIKLVEGAV